MPNNLLTPDVIATTALANLYETTVMASLVHRDYEGEFNRKIGDTVTVRKPAVFEAKEYNRTTRQIEIQDAVEGGIPVVLNHMADVSFAITAEDLTLSLENFNEQLLNPALEAMAQKIDRDVLSLRDDITQTVGAAAFLDENTASPTGQYNWADSRVLVEAGKVLTQQNVATTERRVVTGPETAARWKAERTWRQADKRGSTEGLLEASLGSRVSGFDPYETQNIAPAAAGAVEETVAFHKTAFALVMRPLELPRGAEGRASVQNYQGLSLRVIYGYDMDKKQDVVSIDCLYGVKTLDANRAVLITGPATP